MGGEWRKMPFSQAVMVNPRVQLKRGATYPFVDMGAVSAGSRSAFASEQRQFNCGGSRFAVGDTLMARITPCLENGKIARFAGEAGQIAHGSTEFIVIRGRDGVSDTDYAYYLTKWEGVSGYAISQMTGTSGRQRVPLEALDHLEVPLPPLPEQRAIAHILGTLDDKIELNRKQNETLEAMARALFKAWFVDFEPVRAKIEGRWQRGQSLPGLPAHLYDLFPDRLVESELGEIPEGWSVGSFGSFISQRSERAGKRNVVVLSAVASGMLVRSDDHFTKRVYSKETDKYLVVEQWDYAYNPSRINIGSVGMLEEDILGGVSPVYVVVRPHPTYRWFLWFSIQRAYTKTWINTLASGSVRQSLSYADFASIPCVVPPEEVVEEFNQKWSTLREVILLRDAASRSLAQLRDTLLPKLISGELRVPDAEAFLKERGL